MLTFDEPSHTYRWNERLVPNVTRIIGHLTDYSRIPADVLLRAQQEGKAVHKMVELDCKNDLAVEDLPEWMEGHYQAWRRFLEETGFECWSSEERLYHAKLGYAGTLDLAGLMKNLKTSKAPAVLDVKRSFYAGPAIGLQTVGYLDAWNSNRERPRLYERYGLQLNKNGTYRLLPFEDRDDYTAFLACLQQWRWREKHSKGEAHGQHEGSGLAKAA